MRRFLGWCVLPAIVLAHCSNAFAGSNCYVAMSDPAQKADLEQSIQSYGGRIIHAFPPNEYICEMSGHQWEKLLAEQDLAGDHLDMPATAKGVTATTGVGASCWQTIKEERLNLLSANSQSGVSAENYCGTGRQIERRAKSNAATSFGYPSRNEMFNTNYLVGKVGVCIMLMESSGDQENWTSGDKDFAISQAVAAYDFLSRSAADQNVPLSWVYEIHRQVNTSYEPIDKVYPDWDWLLPGWEFGWIDDALDAYLGVGSGWDGIYANGNRVRSSLKTDWGLTLFIVANASSQAGFGGDGAGGYTQYCFNPANPLREKIPCTFCSSHGAPRSSEFCTRCSS